MMERALILVALFLSTHPAIAQVESTRRGIDASGLLTVTTKGISMFPNFTLGKPAGLAILTLSKGRLSFEPEFKYGLNGKPWNIIFWGRYRLVEQQRLRVGVGLQHLLFFRSTPVSDRDASDEVISARRYVSSEFTSTYSFSNHGGFGPYYIYSFGPDDPEARHIHFVSLRGSFTPGNLSSRVALRFAPQAYYLRMGERDGTYVGAILTLTADGLPVSVSTLANRTIRSDIPGEDFLWNVSLHYLIR